MRHPPAHSRSEPVRVVIEEVPDLEERVRAAARRAHESDRAVELVELIVAHNDHAARALTIQLMDEALAVARRAAPGVEIRVGVPVTIPRPRGTP